MIEWKKATRCDNSGPNCVEVAHTPEGTLVRDTKQPDSPVLRFTPDEWAAFVGGVKDGEFDL